MRQKGSAKGPGQARMWRKGERAKVSIMQVFRNAYEAGDARRGAPAPGDTQRQPRREALDEATLRQHLQIDLNALLNTVDLGSIVDLADLPHARTSIINYGFRDLSNVPAGKINTPQIKALVRQSLINHEPRLLPESIEVEVTEAEGDMRQRAAIVVRADLAGDPVDIPLDFDAEVDLTVGKLKMSKLRIQA